MSLRGACLWLRVPGMRGCAGAGLGWGGGGEREKGLRPGPGGLCPQPARAFESSKRVKYVKAFIKDFIMFSSGEVVKVMVNRVGVGWFCVLFLFGFFPFFI